MNDCFCAETCSTSGITGINAVFISSLIYILKFQNQTTVFSFQNINYIKGTTRGISVNLEMFYYNYFIVVIYIGGL